MPAAVQCLDRRDARRGGQAQTDVAQNRGRQITRLAAHRADARQVVEQPARAAEGPRRVQVEPDGQWREPRGAAAVVVLRVPGDQPGTGEQRGDSFRTKLGGHRNVAIGRHQHEGLGDGGQRGGNEMIQIRRDAVARLGAQPDPDQTVGIGIMLAEQAFALDALGRRLPVAFRPAEVALAAQALRPEAGERVGEIMRIEGQSYDRPAQAFAECHQPPHHAPFHFATLPNPRTGYQAAPTMTARNGCSPLSDVELAGA
ncbi:hypothetical protein [Pseudomonas sp. UBA6310]|uniref:hypothetical protein n=1 Tax=Pseudomonas sp. UBA6310 TaxID=1947327 RepID=UPI00258019BB|nr:hypothetical protein [Pseudomonas sp. UBA6310]